MYTYLTPRRYITLTLKKQYIYIIKLKELRSFCNTETETETQ